MVLTHPFFCPTRVVDGVPYDQAAGELFGKCNWALVTSPTWIANGVDQQLTKTLGTPGVVIGDVAPNPTVSEVFRIAALLPDDIDVVVAVGGGSVIDAAKGMLAVVRPEIGQSGLLTHLKEGSPLTFDGPVQKFAAVPTTSGTGSEVTRWGTIWGDDGIKFSINDPALYPDYALMDPSLCTTMPFELTLATGLDALSHAAESVWNRRHSEVSDGMASQAIRILKENLSAVLENPSDIELRRKIQSASVLAGLAMGTTQTALAHSISYPFTSRFGMPHGLACSFTLPVIADFNGSEDPARLAPIAEGLGCAQADIPDVLTQWFHAMNMSEYVSKYVHSKSADEFDDQLITRARAANNIRDVDSEVAKSLAHAALQEFTK